jgi:ribosomal protein S27AE
MSDYTFDDIDNRALGWDRFSAAVGWTWDEIVETGTGDLTPEEEQAIMSGQFYGRPITRETIQLLKSGQKMPQSKFIFRGRAVDGPWEKTFGSKEELLKHAKLYAPGEPTSKNSWVGEFGEVYEVIGATYPEVEAAYRADQPQARTMDNDDLNRRPFGESTEPHWIGPNTYVIQQEYNGQVYTIETEQIGDSEPANRFIIRDESGEVVGRGTEQMGAETFFHFWKEDQKYNLGLDESAVGTGAVAMGPGGPGYETLKPAKEDDKISKKKKPEQILLGGPDNPKNESFEERLNRVLSDSKNTHFCSHCRYNRVFIEHNDRLTCGTCANVLWRVGSEFVSTNDRSPFQRPPQAAVPTSPLSEDSEIHEMLDANLVNALRSITKPGAKTIGPNATGKKLQKTQAAPPKNPSIEDDERDEEIDELKKAVGLDDE